MWLLITQPENIFFSVALLLMLMLGILEIINLIVGGGSDWLDQLLPDHLIDHHSADISSDVSDSSVFLDFLAWLYIGRIPILMWIVTFLTIYGITGIVLQSILLLLLGNYLSSLVAGVLVFFVALPIVRYAAMLLQRFLPKDETTAITMESLIGSAAQIILGEARPGYPAQAKIKDKHGLTHYIMVEPDQDQILSQGMEILLVSKKKTIFYAIPRD